MRDTRDDLQRNGRDGTANRGKMRERVRRHNQQSMYDFQLLLDSPLLPHFSHVNIFSK